MLYAPDLIMKTILKLASSTRVALAAIALLLSLNTATAQFPNPNQPQIPEPGLPGAYDIFDELGNPIRPDIDAGVNVTPNPDGSMTGQVWIEKDGVVRIIAAEEMVIHVTTVPGSYVWENARGHHGIIVWNTYYGYYESLVISGPNAGTKRIWAD